MKNRLKVLRAERDWSQADLELIQGSPPDRCPQWESTGVGSD